MSGGGAIMAIVWAAGASFGITVGELEEVTHATTRMSGRWELWETQGALWALWGLHGADRGSSAKLRQAG